MNNEQLNNAISEIKNPLVEIKNILDKTEKESVKCQLIEIIHTKSTLYTNVYRRMGCMGKKMP